MATISNIINLVWRNLEGGNIPDDSRFTRREIAIYARAGLAQAIKEHWFELKNQGEDAPRYYSGLSKTSNLPVKTDELNGYQYMDLTDKSLALGGMRNYEITSTNPFSRWSILYVGLRAEEVLVSKLQANVPNVIQFTIKDNKIVFLNGIVTEDNLILQQSLVIPSSDDNEFDLPDETLSRAVIIAIQMAQGEIKVTDRAIDGVPIT